MDRIRVIWYSGRSRYERPVTIYVDDTEYRVDEIKKEYVEEELCGDRKHVWIIRSGISTYKLELYTSGELNFIKL